MTEKKVMEYPYEVQKQAEQVAEIEKAYYGEQIAPQETPEEAPAVEEQNEGTLAQTAEPTDIERERARYSTLEGMYKADGKRYRQQIDDLNRRLAEQENELAEFKRQKQLAERQSLVSEEDTEMYGQDMLDMVRRTARDEAERREIESGAQAKIEKLQAEMNAYREQEKERKRSAFISGLASVLPDWEKQDSDPGFLNWLAQPDEFSGFTRQEILNRAVEAADSGAAARIFKAYRDTQAQNRGQMQNTLARQAAPSHSRSAPIQTEPGTERIWSQYEVADFYEQWRRHQISDEEAVRIEKEIDRAAAEGRIR